SGKPESDPIFKAFNMSRKVVQMQPLLHQNDGIAGLVV
ncbi:MAG: hypothetical protein RL671_691, partial [Pseudomonadota bacterium]